MEKQTIEIREETPEETAQRNTETLADIEAYFKANLKLAEGALTVSYLDDDDRSAIGQAIHGIKCWLPVFLKSDDLDFVRTAGLQLAAHSEAIGVCCEVSNSEAEYWRRKRCAKGGKGEKEKGKRKREAIEAWQFYAEKIEGANTETSITDLAGSLLIDPKKPPATPSNIRTLEKFLSNARKKRLTAGGATPIRLIHSA